MRRITEATMAAVLIGAAATGCGTRGEDGPTQSPEDTAAPVQHRSADDEAANQGASTPSDLLPNGVVAGRIPAVGPGRAMA